jgi:phosphoribosylformylglycinamidine synthase subunit PurSL
MLWEIEIQPKDGSQERDRVRAEYDLLTHTTRGKELVASCSRGYLIEGDLESNEQREALAEMLGDQVVERVRIGRLEDERDSAMAAWMATVLRKPGVMDPVAQSVLETARDLGLPVESVRTFRRYYGDRPFPQDAKETLFCRVLANEAIEQVIEGPLKLDHLGLGTPYAFRLIKVPVRELDATGLERLSREGQLSLSRAEMEAVQAHFREIGREPSDVELETIAQTWSEHCSHKTLKGRIEINGRKIGNLLKETIFGATQEIRRRMGKDDWCVSVFEDNAGIVRFDDRYNLCFKVETHNHPSAIEPYGGANTGLGGVIRDPLGTGLGAKPICNTDVFCFAPPDTDPQSLPPGVLHPKKVMQGVVAGVRDYGNRIGIPTVNGAVCFDERYLANPLVFCGTVGLIPSDRCHKAPKPGDLIVAIGGRTGRDGIHGATFSSVRLTHESEKVSAGAVQIGNAITQKKLLDVVLRARDLNLSHAITDCGAGGFSSAVGEMADGLGAVVDLDQAPLKYEGLSYTEIWISESQERMILAVPPAQWPTLRNLAASEDVEATVLGKFEDTGRLRLLYEKHEVADLDLRFLHHGRPPVVRLANAQPFDPRTALASPASSENKANYGDDLKKILGSLNVCSKEWIVRQYDHEVQGGTVIKPLVGLHDDGPGDAAVVTPVLGSWAGTAVGCGINPRYGDLDPYAMAAAAVDEAVRNVVAVGADPSRIALLDNFCWGNTDQPETLGSLVRAAEACRDVAIAYRMPFISGKDSLNNEFHAAGRNIVIPPTLLISALGYVPDVRQCVTMDLKEAGNVLYLVGVTRDEMGGSHYNLINCWKVGVPPQVDRALAPPIFGAVHEAIRRGLLRSCHDLSEGGLAVAVAEMALAGGVGADLTAVCGGGLSDSVGLFSESASRFLVEVSPELTMSFEACMVNVPCTRIGQTCREERLRVAGRGGEWVVWEPLAGLKEAWQRTLRW